jgi:hypothetical protein
MKRKPGLLVTGGSAEAVDADGAKLLALRELQGPVGMVPLSAGQIFVRNPNPEPGEGEDLKQKPWIREPFRGRARRSVLPAQARSLRNSADIPV